MLRRGWHFGKMPLGLRRVKLGGFGPSSTVRERQSTERRLGRSELSELCSCSTESAQKNPCQGPPRTEPPGRPPESPGGDATRQSQFPASIGSSAIGASPNRPQAPQRHQPSRASELCGPSTASRKRVGPLASCRASASAANQTAAHAWTRSGALQAEPHWGSGPGQSAGAAFRMHPFREIASRGETTGPQHLVGSCRHPPQNCGQCAPEAKT